MRMLFYGSKPTCEVFRMVLPLNIQILKVYFHDFQIEIGSLILVFTKFFMGRNPRLSIKQFEKKTVQNIDLTTPNKFVYFSCKVVPK